MNFRTWIYFLGKPQTTDRYLEVAAVALPECQDEPLEDQLADLRELGVDDGDEGGVDVSEDGRRRLGLEDGASQRAPEGRRGRKTGEM